MEGSPYRRPNIPDTASMMMGAARLPKMAPIPPPVRRRLRCFLTLPAPSVLRPPLGRRRRTRGPNFKDLSI